MRSAIAELNDALQQAAGEPQTCWCRGTVRSSSTISLMQSVICRGALGSTRADNCALSSPRAGASLFPLPKVSQSSSTKPSQDQSTRRGRSDTTINLRLLVATETVAVLMTPSRSSSAHGLKCGPRGSRHLGDARRQSARYRAHRAVTVDTGSASAKRLDRSERS